MLFSVWENPTLASDSSTFGGSVLHVPAPEAASPPLCTTCLPSLPPLPAASLSDFAPGGEHAADNTSTATTKSKAHTLNFVAILLLLSQNSRPSLFSGAALW